MLAIPNSSARKWADYCIVEVYHQGPGRQGPIVAVDVRPDMGDRLGALIHMTLPEVLVLWASGTTFCKVVLRDGKWRYGAPVNPYLRTKPDDDPDNNLD